MTQPMQYFVIKLMHESKNKYGRKVGYGKPKCYLWQVQTEEDLRSIRPDFFGCYGWAVGLNESTFTTTWEQLKQQQIDAMYHTLSRVIDLTEVPDRSYEVQMLRKSIKQLGDMPCPKYPSRVVVAKQKQ